ncbi:MAG TPA: alpha/beta fold hydrolase [Myxococcaceae bacterium]|jgi:alpha-beta hydrolase superfamily lysophospholipase
MTGAVEWVESHRTRLALHAWVPERPRGIAFYVHGIQSHAGWLFETGPFLRGQGVGVYALDRRGSGRSEGPRGEVPSLQVLLDDYAAAFERVRRLHPDRPLALVGQSLGGAIAAGLAAEGRVRPDAIALCAPALAQQRAKLSEAEREAIRKDRSRAPAPLALRDEDYTRAPAFLEFIRTDPLVLRAVGNLTRATLLDLEDYYLSLPNGWPRSPTALVLPRRDAIIRLAAAREAFLALTSGRGMILELPADEHYLEFSEHRDAFRTWLAGFVATSGYGLRP